MSGNVSILLWKDKKRELHYTPGTAEYYMGIDSYEFTGIEYIEKIKFETYSRYIDEKEAFEQYGIKIIS